MQYEKLHYLLENNSSFDDIENQIEALNVKMGSFGKDRILLLNFFFKNIIDYILPNYAKYLMHASEHTEEKNEDRVEKLKKLRYCWFSLSVILTLNTANTSSMNSWTHL